MRKILFTTAVVLATTFAFANNDKGKEQVKNEPKKETKAPESLSLEEAAAFYCEVITKKGTHIICLVCDCKKLAKGMEEDEGDKGNEGNEEDKGDKEGK